MAEGVLQKSLQKVTRRQLREFVRGIARALGPRVGGVSLRGASEGGEVPESDLRSERIERSGNVSSSGSQVDLEGGGVNKGGVNGYISRREAARAKRLMKQVQYAESVLHVTGTAVSAEETTLGRRRQAGKVVVIEGDGSQVEKLVVIGQDPESLLPVRENSARKRIVPLETFRAGVSDSILGGRFHLPPPWGAGTARPLNRKEYSTHIFSQSASPPVSLIQFRGLAAKAKREKKAKGGKGARVAWDTDEETGKAVEVGGSGGNDVERVEPEFDVEGKMEAALAALQKEFGKLRTGRAAPDMLDHVTVEAYGARTPLNRTGTVSVLSPQMLSVTPFDQSLLKAIEKGVRASPMELNPNIEGASVLVPVPTLTQEVRQSMVKVVTKAGESAKLSVRRARKDALDSIKGQEEGMPIDEVKRQEKKVDELTKLYVKRVDEACTAKSKDILGG